MRSVPARKRISSIAQKGKSRSPLKKKNNAKIITRSNKRYFVQMFVGGAVFLASLIFLAGYSIVKYLNQTFASASSSSSYAVLQDGITTISFIEVEDMNSDPVILKGLKYLIYDKNENKLSIFDIPLDLKTDMTGKFGKEEVSKSFALGALNSSDQLKSGVEGVNNVLLRIFGYSVDRYVLVESAFSGELFGALSGEGITGMLDLQTASGLKASTLSNLSITEFTRFVNFASGVPKTNVVHFSVAQADIDDTANIDGQIFDMNFDGKISAEGLSVSILNGTDYPGVALFGARLVGNVGGRVVGVSNASSAYETSYIVTDVKDSATLSYLSRVLGITHIISKNEAFGFNENEIDRSDITVIVGFDTVDTLY